MRWCGVMERELAGSTVGEGCGGCRGEKDRRLAKSGQEQPEKRVAHAGSREAARPRRRTCEMEHGKALVEEVWSGGVDVGASELARNTVQAWICGKSAGFCGSVIEPTGAGRRPGWVLSV
jgi:hypothetical protein